MIKSATTKQIPVIDIFAGPGGLGEGFSRFKAGNTSKFRVQLSIEKDPAAHRTLRLRSLYRNIVETGDSLDGYYDLLLKGADWKQIEAAYPEFAFNAEREAWCAELGKIGAETVDRRIREAIAGHEDDWVLIGGPPCQAYSLVGRSRRKKMTSYRPEKDERTELYKQYLSIIAKRWPTVFVMENVKGLLSQRILEEKIFDRIVEDLQDPAKAMGGQKRQTRYMYDIVSLVAPDDDSHDDPFKYVVHAEQFGIPQARHRVILLGIRSDVRAARPTALSKHAEVAASKVLSGLPALRSGLSKGKDSYTRWSQVLRSALTQSWFESLGKRSRMSTVIRESLSQAHEFEHDRGALCIPANGKVSYCKEWFIDSGQRFIFNHETRGHMEADLHRYLFASAFSMCKGRSPKLADFPKQLLPKHMNVEGDLNKVPFNDRFRVQLSGRPATTVTSHISKDGHYYIHPDPAQCRSLTVREAARLQTFPDSYFFTGNRTEQYVQVGNAVPPLLARAIAEKVYEIFDRRK